MTTYFTPASAAVWAHCSASNLVGLNLAASFTYSSRGTLARSMIHSPIPPIGLPFHSPAGIAYSPQWMNIPNRPSRHQAIRASRWAFVSLGIATVFFAADSPLLPDSALAGVATRAIAVTRMQVPVRTMVRIHVMGSLLFA